MLNEKEIGENFEKYSELLVKFTDPSRVENVKKLLDKYGQRIAMCPSSTREQYHGAYLGGLVKNSINVLTIANKMSKIYSELELGLEGNLALCCLLHDIGKIGTIERERYVMNENTYTRKNGTVFNVEENMPPIHHATNLILQDCQIRLSDDEYQAILLASAGVWSMNELKEYAYKENNLSMLIMQAKRISIQAEKQ